MDAVHANGHDRGCVWITGASSGIGRALAGTMANDGWTVAASALDAEGLEALAEEVGNGPGTIEAFPVDITDRSAVCETFDTIVAKLGAPQAAVLNAGVNHAIDQRSFDVGTFRKTMEVNFLGTVHCLEQVTPVLKRSGFGRVVLMASLAGYVGLPGSAPYSASKAAIIAMAQSLRDDLSHWGITVQLINPGFVRTPMNDIHEFRMPFTIGADEAALKIYDGMQGNRFEIAFPWQTRWSMKLLAALPYPMLFRVLRRMRPPGQA